VITFLASVPPGPASISPSDVAVQAIKSVIVVTFLLVGFRLLGKREMAQLSVYDLAMLFALSNAVQNAMTGGKGNLAVGLATSSAVVIAAWALTRVIARQPRLEARVIGSPTVLVHDGQVLAGRLRRQRVTDDELMAALRAYGLEDPRDVALAVLEVDGSISVVPRPASGPQGSP
jgi:uncharacterized membrane protein YcaP (DUF421 family)